MTLCLFTVIWFLGGLTAKQTKLRLCREDGIANQSTVSFISERGQIVKGHPHTMNDDGDDSGNNDDDDDDDPLRKLMKRKHMKNKEQEGDENDEMENKDDGEEQEDNMGEKKSKIQIPARFIGKR